MPFVQRPNFPLAYHLLQITGQAKTKAEMGEGEAPKAKAEMGEGKKPSKSVRKHIREKKAKARKLQVYNLKPTQQ